MRQFFCGLLGATLFYLFIGFVVADFGWIYTLWIQPDEMALRFFAAIFLIWSFCIGGAVSS